MPISRRTLLKTTAALLPAALLPSSATALAAVEANDLVALGLDPYITYRKMFSSTKNDARLCWWYLGTGKIDVTDIGLVPNSQVETIMIYRTEDLPDGGVNVYWKEIGCFRDITTGELPGPWRNPVTGKSDPRRPSFQDGPAHYTIHREAGGVKLALDQQRAEVKNISANFSVANGQVCLTQFEDKVRSFDATPSMTIRTTLKIYSSITDVKNPALASVPSSGFYKSGTAATGGPNFFGVDGLMQKAAVDEKLNPTGWARMKQAYPDFFKSDRVDPSWK